MKMKRSLSWVFDQRKKEVLSRELSDFENPSMFVRESLEIGDVKETIALAKKGTGTVQLAYEVLYERLVKLLHMTAETRLRAIVGLRLALWLLAVVIPAALAWKLWGLDFMLKVVWAGFVIELVLLWRILSSSVSAKLLASISMKRQIVAMKYFSYKEGERTERGEALIGMALEYLAATDVFPTDRVPAKTEVYDEGTEFRTIQWGYGDDET